MELFTKTKKTISILFFDVTTLYFEAFEEDDFRKFGFSKDHKSNQPQHLRSFSGNKFEGHIIIPCIQNIRQKHKLDDLIVVADSAMVSQTNMEKLEKQKGQLKDLVWEKTES